MNNFTKSTIHFLDVMVIILSALLFTGVSLSLLAQAGMPTSGAVYFFLSTLIQNSFFMLGLMFFLLVIRKNTFTDIRLVRTDWRGMLMGFVAGFGIYVVLLLFMVLLNWFMPNGIPPQNVEQFIRPGDPLHHKALVLLTVGILAPVAEENLFRGYLFSSLEKRVSPLLAMGITSLIFAAVHGDLLRALPIGLGGFLLNWVVWKSGSVVPAMIAHGIWNIFMVTVYYLSTSSIGMI